LYHPVSWKRKEESAKWKAVKCQAVKCEVPSAEY